MDPNLIQDDGTYSKIKGYLIIKFLDKGGQGKVKLCTKSGQLFAIKIHKSINISDKDKEDMRREVNAFKQIGEHPNILKFVDYFEDQDYIKKNGKGSYKATCIVLEYIENGSIFDYIKAMEGFHRLIAKYYFKQQIQALQHMHKKGVSHRDIKLENTLINENYELKICDLGFAGKVQEIQYEPFGTEIYAAPEVKNGQGYYGERIDVYSAGVSFFVFNFGRYPFGDDKEYRLFLNDNQKYWEKLLAYLKKNKIQHSWIDKSFIQLINYMLIDDQERRWSTQQVLDSEYIQTEERIQMNRQEFEINQEMIGFNLGEFRQQVEQDREKAIKNQKKTKQNVTGYRNGDNNNKKGRDVPEGLEGEIQSIQKEFCDILEKKRNIKFQDQVIVNKNYNQFIHIVLLNSQVEAVLIFILRQIKIEGFEFEKVKISENKAGKITAEYQSRENDQGEFETLEVSTTVELVEKTERKQEEEQFMVFQIGLVRKQGQYLEFRNAQEQFEELSKQFA